MVLSIKEGYVAIDEDGEVVTEEHTLAEVTKKVESFYNNDNFHPVVKIYQFKQIGDMLPYFEYQFEPTEE